MSVRVQACPVCQFVNVSVPVCLCASMAVCQVCHCQCASLSLFSRSSVPVYQVVSVPVILYQSSVCTKNSAGRSVQPELPSSGYPLWPLQLGSG